MLSNRIARSDCLVPISQAARGPKVEVEYVQTFFCSFLLTWLGTPPCEVYRPNSLQNDDTLPPEQ